MFQEIRTQGVFYEQLLREKLLDPTETYAEGTNCVKKHVLSRFLFTIATPLCVIATALDVILGLVAALFIPVCCFINDSFKNHFFSISHIITRPYQAFLKVLNPQIDFNDFAMDRTVVINRNILGRERGFLSSFVWENMTPLIRYYFKEGSNCFYRQVSSRLLSVGFLIAVATARVADAAIALLVAPLALVAALITGVVGGTTKCQSLYNLTNRTLQFTGIANDLLLGVFMIIYPRFKI